MPRLALTICVLWFFSLFVFRSLLQWRRTGSTGIKGFHGAFGSLPWIAGASSSLGLVLAPLAPLAALLAWPGGSLLTQHPPIHFLGLAMASIGTLGALMAQLSMGDSWRIGVDESESTALVTDGSFGWVRNPIFSFVSLSALGLVLLVPNVLSILSAALTVIGIQLQVRVVEEPHLIETHGGEYLGYASRVGRFVPGLGRLPERADPAPSVRS